MIERWFQKIYPQINQKLSLMAQKELNRYKNMTSARFSVIIFVFSIFISGFITVAVITKQYSLFLGVALFFGLNIFTHPLQTLFIKKYTPGIVTTFLLIIPYYGLFFIRFFHTDLFSFASLLQAMMVAIFLIPIFLLSHKIGEKWG